MRKVSSRARGNGLPERAAPRGFEGVSSQVGRSSQSRHLLEVAKRREEKMKLSSISGIHCYVHDLSRTAEFYEALGFRRGKEEPGRLTFYVNWFFVTFIDEGQEDDAESRNEARRPDKGAGLFLYLKVDDIVDFHEGVLAEGMKPVSEPRTGPNRTREFMLRDPDGYKLVFFEKK
jgi:catechol 2,3-dioxygenase-like lactoylglutathione lyase family enzyme